jgi:hypothetical protein
MSAPVRAKPAAPYPAGGSAVRANPTDGGFAAGAGGLQSYLRATQRGCEAGFSSRRPASFFVRGLPENAAGKAVGRIGVNPVRRPCRALRALARTGAGVAAPAPVSTYAARH